MLSISAINGAAAYYSHEDNYYASDSLESRWLGEGAEKLGLKGEVASADMDAVREGKLPDGTDLSRMISGVNKHRSGYDLTFSAPKSVSMMILIGGDTRLLDAWNRSVENGMKEVEKLISARITEGEKTDTVLTGNMVAALYNHDTSRALDPQIHTHALVFNATFAEDKWRALASDTRMKTGFGENLYAMQVAIGNLVLQPFRQEAEKLGYVANSLWEVAGFTDDGAIRFRQGEQMKIIDPQTMTEDRHIDLAYALTVHGVQGASERFAIALLGAEGGRKQMASLESLYVTLSRAKEHVQVFTDNLARWQQLIQQSDSGKTAHDLLHQKSDREAATGSRLLATASRLDKTVLGRRVLAENGLEGETMARFIAAGRKYPTPCMALPAWTRHGKEAGALLTEIRLEDDGMRVVLSDESRLRGGEDAQFAGLQASRNGQTLIADDAQAALRLAQENPESGVVIRLHGEDRLLNAARLTGGRITAPDEVARTVRSVAEAESAAKAEDPITLPPDEQQKLAEAQEKAARELAEQARQEVMPAVPDGESARSEPLISANEAIRLRESAERGERERDEAIREAVADGRDSRQQIRQQILRTEREWVVNVPEKDIELEKTLSGD
ncbi:TPA: conjugative relaxase [Escherichia coli]|nr:conjugative relaxase [Escherichia coli]